MVVGGGNADSAPMPPTGFRSRSSREGRIRPSWLGVSLVLEKIRFSPLRLSPAVKCLMFQVQIRSHPLRVDLPDLGLLDGVVAPQVLAAMKAAAEKLHSSGIRYALAGALA